MLKLIEPVWGIELLKALNQWMNANYLLTYLMPKLADIFVFSYPIFLVGLYITGWVKKNIYYKKASMSIFVGTLFSTIVNVSIQFFIDKVRPNIVLGLVDEKTESILHKFLPSSSFPSDHAAVSMGFAVATLFWGIKNKDRTFVGFGIVFLIFSLIMSFARITIAVHWPTDIIGGLFVGIFVIIIFHNKKLFSFFDRIFCWIGHKI